MNHTCHFPECDPNQCAVCADCKACHAPPPSPPPAPAQPSPWRCRQCGREITPLNIDLCACGAFV